MAESLIVTAPRTYAERAAVASVCVTNLSLRIPAVLDDFTNSTERAYTGWPDRLYLIDRQGRIVYKSRPGPFGFIASELDAALRLHVSQASGN